FVFLSSAAFSAAEKRDYEPSFFTRQQLFELLRCDGEGFSFVCVRVTTTTPTAPLPFFSRTAFPVARKRRDSMHPPLAMQPLYENILKKPPGLSRTAASGVVLITLYIYRRTNEVPAG
ncbi:hypothetical protein, partial [Burkholderia vietnamiensis]|uniref:hypothetical protein n=2 Tax=Burkholderia vietnamiensis TaxID=60552 RepID=UPI001B91CD10